MKKATTTLRISNFSDIGFSRGMRKTNWRKTARFDQKNVPKSATGLNEDPTWMPFYTMNLSY